jgi:hypothetical protein
MITHLLLPSLVLLFYLLFNPVEATSCSCIRDGIVSDCAETPCGANSSVVTGGAQLCCVNGDVCGADNICHFTKNIPNTSGFYLGGCTDPTWTDPACQQHCSEYFLFSQGCDWYVENCGGK